MKVKLTAEFYITFTISGEEIHTITDNTCVF